MAQKISLNGKWQFGIERNYNKEVTVPGVVTNPMQFSPDKIWYKKELILPCGDWDYAILELHGARFSPEVYINNELVSRISGGMAPTFHLLKNEKLRPGGNINLEIALSSLKNLSDTDASYIAKADHWRTNISSYIWDDVCIRFCKSVNINRLIPTYDLQRKLIMLNYEINDKNKLISNSYDFEVIIEDVTGHQIIKRELNSKIKKGVLEINYGDDLKLWTPETPILYKLIFRLIESGKICDSKVSNLGIRNFEVKNKQFFLNNNLCKIRAGTVCWHRWSRNIENADLINDTTWFIKNVILPLKNRGANTLRFHLGPPPECLLDLCDKYGLLVQYEWSLFHGMPASKESLIEQWRCWLDKAMDHPSVVLFHPYNETNSSELKTAWDALNEILPDYPKLIFADRDVLHLHKYWWSLFENLGLYYDSYSEFPKAIMVDEFGGNYLDGQGNMGAYPTVKESYLRFLGRNTTAKQRLYQQAVSNSKVAEYWRRLGAAGFSPFCIISSSEDGNNWYMDDMHKGILKPVWDELTAAWSPKSLSIEMWDKNFSTSQNIKFPLYLFNDTNLPDYYKVKVSVVDSFGNSINTIFFDKYVNAFSTKIDTVSISLPNTEGKYELIAELENRPSEIKCPVQSKWNINVFNLKVDKRISRLNIFTPADEIEIRDFMIQNKFKTIKKIHRNTDVLILSNKTWQKIENKDRKTISFIEKAINSGTSILFLDIGELELGQGYTDSIGKMSFLQQGIKLPIYPKKVYNIGNGIELSFTKIAEPESCIHPATNNNFLWKNIPTNYTQLWNGLRGGLIVPAVNMDIYGLNQKAFITNWVSKGADEEKIKTGNYYAYNLQGFYAFSDLKNDSKACENLRSKVKFLAEDAPALENMINPNAEIEVTDLNRGYQKAKNGRAYQIIPLVNSGRNLTQTPVVMIEFGSGKGKLILSQLITSGRLLKSNNDNKTYSVKYDVVAAQMVLNMIELVTQK